MVDKIISIQDWELQVSVICVRGNSHSRLLVFELGGGNTRGFKDLSNKDISDINLPLDIPNVSGMGVLIRWRKINYARQFSRCIETDQEMHPTLQSSQPHLLNS